MTIYAPKPDPGPLGARVLATRPELRKLLKAGLLVAAIEGQPLTFILDGVTVKLRERPSVSPCGWLEMWLTAERGGQSLYVDNPYQFENPPLETHDGTWRQETDGITKARDVKNMTEQPLSALQRMIVAAVLNVADR